MIAGAVLLVVGSVLTWFTFGDLDVNGFTTLPNASDEEQVRDGPVFVFFAVVLAGFGIATLAARRNLAVAILAVIAGALATLAALIDLIDVLDLGDAVDVGPGLPIVMIGALVGLVGSIVVLAKRRG